MLLIVGIIFLIASIIFIYLNKKEDTNVFDAILDKGEKYVDYITVPDKAAIKIKKPREKNLDVPLMKPDTFEGELECPVSLGKGGMKNEKRCRKVLETIFGVDFPTVRPSWLKNPGTKRNLEIDCYNHDLRIGLEYSPDSSHTTVGTFHKTKESLIYQIRKDQWKAKRCKELGITLITVPSWAVSDLKGYITRKLQESGKMPN